MYIHIPLGQVMSPVKIKIYLNQFVMDVFLCKIKFWRRSLFFILFIWGCLPFRKSKCLKIKSFEFEDIFVQIGLFFSRPYKTNKMTLISLRFNYLKKNVQFCKLGDNFFLFWQNLKNVGLRAKNVLLSIVWSHFLTRMVFLQSSIIETFYAHGNSFFH